MVERWRGWRREMRRGTGSRVVQWVGWRVWWLWVLLLLALLVELEPM
jgi:Mn2+/Fe2+ NRAMP family transporter